MKKFDNLRDKILPVLQPYGVERVALFGSIVRGEETPESDIDILVTFGDPIGLFKLTFKKSGALLLAIFRS